MQIFPARGCWVESHNGREKLLSESQEETSFLITVLFYKHAYYKM